ncbi:unnamed protein product [Penicillium olsonii]|nr:unnamed protein product [Penicillium olsonii]
MVELDGSVMQHSPQDMEELPPSVKVYHYKDIDDFSRVVSLEIDLLYGFLRAERTTSALASGSCEGRQDYVITLPQTQGTQSDHVIFIIEPSAFARDFLNVGDHSPCHAKISYNPATNILVAKMPEATHEQAAVAFNDMLMRALQPLGLEREIRSWGAAKLTAADGTSKEANAGWGPRRPPRGAPKRPSVVLEVGSSETSAKLRRDAHYWVDPARGKADMAIGVKVYAKKPQITIDLWEWNSQRSRPIQRAHLTMMKSHGNVHFDPDQPTPQLSIPFNLFFRRPAENKKERDIFFLTQELVEFATLVWEMQFENE